MRHAEGPSKTEFIDQVADAYGHLYDLVYLRNQPLADVLIPDPSARRKEKALQLHRILVDIIEELRPGPQASIFSRQWRRHQLMVLRYVKGLDPQAVADQFTIGRRHYYREHKAALEAVAGILWERYVVRSSTPRPIPQTPEQEAQISHLELMRLEAARTAKADRHARVAEVIQGVISLLHEMLNQHDLDVQPALPETLPDVSIDRSLLRQLILGMLGYLIQGTHRAAIRLAAQVEGAVVHLTLAVEPSSAMQPTPLAETQERLSTLEEMATVSGAHILPVRVGPSVVGFDVELPAVQRTILVIDDNEDVLELFQRYLSPHYYRVATAQTAGDALTLVRQLKPFAITLDLMMPDQDGWDLLQVMLNQPDTRHIPIIVCSVLKQKELALSMGATAFLEKPVMEPVLLAALEALEKA